MSAPKVDVGALAGGLYLDAAKALAETVTVGITWCEENNRELNEHQKTELLRAMLAASANLEAKFARELIDTFHRDGIETWGLSDDLASVLGAHGDA